MSHWNYNKIKDKKHMHQIVPKHKACWELSKKVHFLIGQGGESVRQMTINSQRETNTPRVVQSQWLNQYHWRYIVGPPW